MVCLQTSKISLLIGSSSLTSFNLVQRLPVQKNSHEILIYSFQEISSEYQQQAATSHQTKIDYTLQLAPQTKGAQSFVAARHQQPCWFLMCNCPSACSSRLASDTKHFDHPTVRQIFHATAGPASLQRTRQACYSILRASSTEQFARGIQESALSPKDTGKLYFNQHSC